uniref:D-aspartate oxidase n=1 Tax=Magallana gigas TaxID=29159 RepID=K1P0Z7_MAGGI
MPNIAVLGAGIIGVSTALNIQNLIPSAQVKIISEKFGQETTSWGAGGLFRPTAKFIQGVPEEKIRRWARVGWDFYSSLAVSDKAKDSGMQIVSGFILSQTKVELVGQYDLVVNCTGIGSRSLFGDTSIFPVRGQLLRVVQYYGHGANGVSMSCGTSIDAAELVKDAL